VKDEVKWSSTVAVQLFSWSFAQFGIWLLVSVTSPQLTFRGPSGLPGSSNGAECRLPVAENVRIITVDDDILKSIGIGLARSGTLDLGDGGSIGRARIRGPEALAGWRVDRRLERHHRRGRIVFVEDFERRGPAVSGIDRSVALGLETGIAEMALRVVIPCHMAVERTGVGVRRDIGPVGIQHRHSRIC
jgi:hypothetical protein